MTPANQEIGNAYSLWSDAETEVDLLGFSYLVDAVEYLVKAKHLLPATIGVFGEWGSGKTSVMKMAATRLQEDEKTIVLWFDGWLFEGYDQAKATLMECLVSQLVSKECTSVKMKRLAIRLFRRINWLRVAGAALKVGGSLAVGGAPLAGLTMAASLPELATKVGETLEEVSDNVLDDCLEDDLAKTFSRNVLGFRKDFTELLASASIDQLVVLIDDLDRCLPPTIIQTLEAIKLFLSVGNVAFVIGADERLVQYAVRERFPELPGERVDVGRDYLEKLIQYPVRIPPLSVSDVQSYIALLFVVAEGEESVVSKSMDWFHVPKRSVSGVPFGHDAVNELAIEVSESLSDGLTLAAQIGPVLGKGLRGNPRQCKRFLNMLMMRLRMGRSRGCDLSRRLMAKLMVLEYLRPEFFRQLGDMQAEGQGKPEPVLAWQTQQAIEESSGPGAGASESTRERLDPRMDVWLNDPVGKQWLASAPLLDDSDLGPYFYFARDSLAGHGQQAQRMSPAARDVFRKLLSQSEAMQRNGFTGLADLSPVDASSVIAVLCDRARETENADAISLILKAGDARKDTLSDVIAFLSGTTHARIPVSAPPLLANAVRGTDLADSALSVLQQWAAGQNPRLAKAAEQVIARSYKELM